MSEATGSDRAVDGAVSDALARLGRCKPLREVLGSDFVDLLIAVKHTEFNQYQDVISPWEREHLLLNV